MKKERRDAIRKAVRISDGELIELLDQLDRMQTVIAEARNWCYSSNKYDEEDLSVAVTNYDAKYGGED